MIKVMDIYNFIDEIAPFSTQEGWDNSGMLVGDFDKEVKCIAVVLDVTKAAISTAKEMGADVIISHHPVIFKPQKNIKKDNIVYDLISNDISVICSHTPLDAAVGGVNDVLSQLLKLNNVFPMSDLNGQPTLVKIGDFPTELNINELEYISANVKNADLDVSNLSSAEFSAFVKQTLGTNNVRFCKGSSPIKTVAVCGGAGCSFLQDVIASGVDAFVTGDASYHDFLDARSAGLTLVSAGHFSTEDPVVAPLARKLAGKFPSVKIIRLKQLNPVLSI